MSEAKDKALSLIADLTQKNLLNKIVAQIEKDLSRAGVTEDYYDLNKEGLFEALQAVLNRLIIDKTDLLYTFLYTVDVSEISIRNIVERNTHIGVDELVHLILKREYMKIAYRAGFL